jgi:hypothetical protein
LQYINTSQFSINGTAYKGVVVPSSSSSVFIVTQRDDTKTFHNIQVTESQYLTMVPFMQYLPAEIINIVGSNFTSFLTTTSSLVEWFLVSAPVASTQSNVNLFNNTVNIYITNTNNLYWNSVNNKISLSENAGMFIFDRITDSNIVIGSGGGNGGGGLTLIPSAAAASFIIPFSPVSTGAITTLNTNTGINYNPSTNAMTIGSVITNKIGSGASPSDINTVSFGTLAGESDITVNSIDIGFQAGRNNTGDTCISIGRNSGDNNSGSSSVLVGAETGMNSNGDNVIFIGKSAGKDNTGFGTLAIGSNAGNTNKGSDCTMLGTFVGRFNEGDNGVLIGVSAGESNSGNDVIAIGRDVAKLNTGNNVIAIGQDAANENTGDDVIAIGRDAAKVNAGTNVVAIGPGTLANNTANNNIAIGSNASNLVNDVNGNNNISIGENALSSLIAGNNNTAIGFIASSAYTGSESNNINIGNTGILGDNNIIRIGNDTHRYTSVPSQFIYRTTEIQYSGINGTFTFAADAYVSPTGGLIVSGSSGNTSIQLPDAADFVAILPNLSDGDTFQFTILNVPNHTITLLNGVGVTVVLNPIILGGTVRNVVMRYDAGTWIAF